MVAGAGDVRAIENLKETCPQLSLRAFTPGPRPRIQPCADGPAIPGLPVPGSGFSPKRLVAGLGLFFVTGRQCQE